MEMLQMYEDKLKLAKKYSIPDVILFLFFGPF